MQIEHRGPGAQGIGARLLRKEDERYVRGQGQFVGDIDLPRMHDVVFLRSPVAHARIRSIRIPPELRERVLIAAANQGAPGSACMAATST